jgi:Spy/CpxP family protein refolding chaperone
MKRTIVLLLVVAIMIVFSVSLAAQPFMGGEQMGRRGIMGPSPTRIYSLLKEKQKDFNITDSQLEQIKNITFALEEKLIPLESKSKLHRLELKKLLMMEKKDYKKISEILSQISANRSAVFIEGMKTKDMIDGILTPEQRDAIKEARQNRFKDRMLPRELR